MVQKAPAPLPAQHTAGADTDAEAANAQDQRPLPGITVDNHPTFVDLDGSLGAEWVSDDAEKQCVVEGAALQPLQVASLDDNYTSAFATPEIPVRGSSAPFENTHFELKLETMELVDPSYTGPQFDASRPFAVEAGKHHGPYNHAPTGIEPGEMAVDENSTAGTVVGELHTLDADRGDSHFYEIVGGHPLFEIDGDEIRVKAGAHLDFEMQNSYDIVVRSTDGAGKSVTETVHITIKDVNEAPTAILPDAASVDENSAGGTLVAHLSTLDPDHGDSHTYEILGGNPLFEIDGDAIRVKAGAQLDYETQDGYDLTVRSTDAHGLSVTETVHVAINDVNEAPTATAIADQTASAGAHFTLASAGHFADVDHGDHLTYSMTGPDWLSIDPHTGIISGTVPATLGIQDIAIDDGLASIPGAGVLHLETDFFSSTAGYNNTFGYYIADAQGNPLGGAVIEANAHETGQHDTFIDLSSYQGAAMIGFFLVQDGASNFPSLADGTTVTFDQVGGQWKVFADGTLLDYDGKTVLFSDVNLNGDHYDHVKDTGNPGTQNWEDLWGGGDQNFNDVNLNASLHYIQLTPDAADQAITITATDQGGLTAHTSFNLDLTNGTAAFASLHEGTSGGDVLISSGFGDLLSGGAGGDVLIGSEGNDYLVGGGGNDIMLAGSGNDLLYGGLGSDIMFGDAGSDRFAFTSLDGHDTVFGGSGGNWMDVIDLAGLSGPEAHDWTLVLTQGSIVEQTAHDITLSADAHGLIQYAGDTRIAFHEIESIHH